MSSKSYSLHCASTSFVCRNRRKWCQVRGSATCGTVDSVYVVVHSLVIESFQEDVPGRMEKAECQRQSKRRVGPFSGPLGAAKHRNGHRGEAALVVDQKLGVTDAHTMRLSLTTRGDRSLPAPVGASVHPVRGPPLSLRRPLLGIKRGLEEEL